MTATSANAAYFWLGVLCVITLSIQAFILIRWRVRQKYIRVKDAVRAARTQLENKVGYQYPSRVDEVRDRPVSGWYILLSYKPFFSVNDLWRGEWVPVAYEVSPTLFGVKVTEVVWSVVAGGGRNFEVRPPNT